jgi:sirohydrochlorin cobaltochelatase
VNELSLEQLLESEFASGAVVIGEVLIRRRDDGALELMPANHGEETERFAAEDAIEIAKLDDFGDYRPLRTAPNLRHGWKILVPNLPAAIEAIDSIYPGRLAAWHAWKEDRLTTTALRMTLNRQSGIYRVAAKISDEQINDLVGNFCRSDGGCLRTILWKRDKTGACSSNKLPPGKFDPAVDQSGRSNRCIPLLCPEACNLLVAACRQVVRGER